MLAPGGLPILRAGAGVAQLVEHRIRNAGVGGSNPLPGTTLPATQRIPFPARFSLRMLHLAGHAGCDVRSMVIRKPSRGPARFPLARPSANGAADSSYPRPVKIRTFGMFRVALDGQDLQLPGRGPQKPLHLLQALLAINPTVRP